MEEAVGSNGGNQDAQQALDELYFVVQLFSYPGNYVAENPNIERIAETLDKFEENMLDVRTATVRARRRATITFGEPVAVQRDGKKKMTAASLTEILEAEVQKLLDAV